MVRKLLVPLLLLLGVLTWQTPGLAQTKDDPKKGDDKQAEENKKWLGFWQTKHGPYKEYWRFTEKDGKLLIEGAFVDNKNLFAGKFLGGEPKFENGVFTFTREWFEKPPSDNEDSMKITAALMADGQTLQYSAKGIGVAKSYVMSKMVQPPTIGPQATDLVGMWKAHVEGMDEILVIKPVGNAFQVQMTWTYFGKTVGLMVPTAGLWNPTNGELKFQQIMNPPPKKGWHNGNLITVHLLKSGHLRYHWQHQTGGTGHRDFTLVPGTGVVKVNPLPPDDPSPKPIDPVPQPSFDPQAVIGSFSGDIDGFKEIWTITKDDAGQWAVKGAFVKGDDEVGGFAGRNPTIKDGKLTFVQEFTQLPSGAVWVNGSTITIVPGANNTINYTWTVGGSTGARTLMKGR